MWLILRLGNKHVAASVPHLRVRERKRERQVDQRRRFIADMGDLMNGFSGGARFTSSASVPARQ